MSNEIEEIQTTFNEDPIEVLVADGEVENLDAEEEVEGIGAVGFSMRTTKPGAGNKFYIRKANGGYSTCITGKPTDKDCNVLANCVGYACGRFNEIIGSMKYPNLNCNAENFIERAQSAGLKVGNTPRVGAIICWKKGDTLSGSDGAGHVEVVEKIYDKNHIYTSSSGYNSSKPFWNSHRYNNNGKWGIGSGYSFRGFIYNPDIDDSEIPAASPSDKFSIGDQVYIEGNLYVSSNAAKPSGYATKKLTKVTRVNKGSAHPYNTTGDLGWMDESCLTKYTAEPVNTTGLAVGDKVQIVGYGNGSSYGDSNRAGGIGWERQILKIWLGRKFPYQVGNNTGTTGFYKADALKKL